MPTRQLPLVVDHAAEEGRLPLPLKIALGEQLVEVIGAGTKVPTRRVVEVSNSVDDQSSLTIRVVQGASNRPEANAPVGTYVIGDIPKAPRGTLAIQLAFEVTPSLGFNLYASSADQEHEIDLVNPGQALGAKAITALMEEEDRDALPPFDGTYDRAAFHHQAIADEALAEDQAYVHTGMFLGWLVDNGLCKPGFLAQAGAEFAQFQARKLSAPQLYKTWKGHLHEDMLSESGNAFARHYFDFDRGQYLEDYQAVLAPEGATLLAVQDNWENFHRISARIRERFEAFKSR